ncbi:MAG TPA: hypothetical protein VG013_38450 [Gemmataceae bacterium]|jgi:hypothetical protein|nr:hypothetical protein [Gemmataceae bacterium]
MIRVTGRYRNQKLELDQPLDLAEGAAVEIAIRPLDQEAFQVDEGWREVGMGRLEQEWDNQQDAVYDDWGKLYGG